MRRFFKWVFRGLLISGLVLLCVGLWKKDELKRLMAVNTVFDEDKIVGNFSNMDRAFLTRDVPRGDGSLSELPKGPDATLPATTGQWIIDRAVTSLLVLKDGQIVHESYQLGTEAEDRRISWSVAKSYLSALFGIVLEDGDITSINDPVTKYAPELMGSAYEGASIEDVLQMESGVAFNEDYLDYNSDINRMGRVLALGRLMDDFTTALTERTSEPGADWKYVSIDTHVISMVIRGATGQDIPTLLSEKIIQPLGLEQDPYYITDGAGVAFVLGGLNVTTRDYARFGLMIAQNGQYGGQQIVPADWVAASTRPSAKTTETETSYGYQWWIPLGSEPGQFLARGIYGQYIYIDQTRDVVIVTTAADRQFREPGVNDSNVAMFRLIAEGL